MATGRKWGAPAMASLIVFPVTYIFRTTGQVLGVSLSGTLLQGVLLSKLQQRIHGPNAEEVCHKPPSHSETLNDLQTK